MPPKIKERIAPMPGASEGWKCPTLMPCVTHITQVQYPVQRVAEPQVNAPLTICAHAMSPKLFLTVHGIDDVNGDEPIEQ